MIYLQAKHLISRFHKRPSICLFLNGYHSQLDQMIYHAIRLQDWLVRNWKFKPGLIPVGIAPVIFISAASSDLATLCCAAHMKTGLQRKILSSEDLGIKDNFVTQMSSTGLLPRSIVTRDAPQR